MNSNDTFGSAVGLSMAFLLGLCGGCSKHKGESRITGKASDAPVSLRCVWKPGYRYHVRMELQDVSEAAGVPDPNELEAHRVTFAQECMIIATNARKSDTVALDLEILALSMERAKGTALTVSFDSDQGGEATDDYGYVPVLQNMVGAHLQFWISPDGKMQRAMGIPELLSRGLGDSPARANGPRPPTRKRIPPGKAPAAGGGVPSPTNEPTNLIQQIAAMASPPPPAAGPNVARGRSTVANTLRNFFSADLFRQMLEFNFLPPDPVRVGQEWKSRGETLIGRNRIGFEATSKFVGWQQQRETNSARVNVHGHVAPPGPAGRTNMPPAKENLTATLWIDTQLNFPVTSAVDAHMTTPESTNTRGKGTNNIVTRTASKSIHQNVTIRLLEAMPIEAANAAEADGK